MPCLSCGKPLALDADVRRSYCAQRCRSRAFRTRDKAFRATAESLLVRQASAVIAGDFPALAAIQREAALLFG